MLENCDEKTSREIRRAKTSEEKDNREVRKSKH